MAQIDIQELDWDHVNEQHMLQTHGITKEDLEAVCYGNSANLYVEDAHTGRLRVMGPQGDGKILVVILSPKGGGRFYPVTAKPTKRQELRRYNDWKAGHQP
ncbi:MAG TPA: hypothetical protein VJQ45_10745 [Ktedonobacterales bacterium]|nr:hypothetical protein [Ktedonobacterales bacterium]